jgi:hypothetical protein
MPTSYSQNSPTVKDAQINITSKLPLQTIATYLTVFFFIYLFLTGATYKFYASMLFLFYSWIQQMWIAVVCLGLFQALIMIPFRIINLKISNHINEFKEKTSQLKNDNDQSFLVKRGIQKGNRPLLFYTIDFVIQLTLYVSIGRLFLTDFYSTPLNPNLLFSFVPYPQYPIQETFFKIPYPKFTTTIDLGLGAVLMLWTVLILLQFGVYAYRYARQKAKSKKQLKLPQQLKKYVKYISGNIFVLFIISWIILRHFPTDWQLQIFSGDISTPNRTFNTVTAIVTFATIVWFGTSRIARKTKIAQAQEIDKEIVFKTQKDMFKDTFKSATLIGLGAYFITRQIPSAFELSIFTFELIAIMSPFTLDRLITSTF